MNILVTTIYDTAKAPRALGKGCLQSLLHPTGTKLRPWQNWCQARLPPEQAHDWDCVNTR